MPNSDFFWKRNTFFPGSRHCAAPVSQKCSDLDLNNLYILVLGIANSLGKMIFCRPAFAFRSPARALAAGLPRQNHVYRTTNESFFCTSKNLMNSGCVVNWIPLRICVRSRNTPTPKLKCQPIRSRRVLFNLSFKNYGCSFAECYVGLFVRQILSNFLESV